MPVNAIFWTLKEVVILYKRCTSSSFPHTPVKQSFVELSIRSGFLQRCRVFFINSEPPILKTLKLLTVNSHRNMQITTKWAKMKIPLLFTKRIHCWYTTLVIFATIAALGVPVLSLKGSISYNHMDIMITSASVQLCSKQQMHPFRHAWCFSFFLCWCFMALPLHPLLKAILYTNHYIKTEAQGQPLSTCQHDESISPTFIYNK